MDTTWMDLKDFMLSENRQSQKTIYYYDFIYINHQNDKTKEMKTAQWFPGIRDNTEEATIKKNHEGDC